MALESLKNSLPSFEPIDNSNSIHGAPNSDHNEKHSELDNLPGNQIYTKNNRYESSLSKDGNLPTKAPDLISESQNPLLLSHWSNVGAIGESINQSVDFQNAALGGFTHPTPEPFPLGFTTNPVSKKTLFGNGNEVFSLFNDGIGDIFNESINYSNGFRVISSQKGYYDDDDVTFGEQSILSKGNIVTKQGYPSINNLYESWKPSNESPTKYNPSGKKLQAPSIDINPTSNFVENQDYTLSELGKDNYTFNTLFTDDQKSKTSDRLNLNKGFDPFSGYRGAEPYVISRTGGERGILRKTELSSRMLPLGRTTKDIERIGKFLLSPAGLVFMAKENILARFNTYQPRLYNPLSLGSAFPLFVPIKFRMSRGYLIPSAEKKYQDYVYDTKNMNNAPDTNKAIAETVKNVAKRFDAGSGNAFQVLGINADGTLSPDFTNISPAPHNEPVSLFLGPEISNLKRRFNSSEQTRNLKNNRLANPMILNIGESRITLNTVGSDSTRASYGMQGKLNSVLTLLGQYGTYTERRSGTEEKQGGEIPSTTQTNKDYPFLTLGMLGNHKSVYDKFDKESTNAGEKSLHDNINSPTEEQQEKIKNQFKKYSEIQKDPENQRYTKNLEGGIGNYYPDNLKPKVTPFNSLRGDMMTLFPITQAQTLDEAQTLNGLESGEIEKEKHGNLVYFKDLRDNSYVFFRGYITGLTESITPTWGSEVYVGRSAPVYNYESTERNISFNLKLAASSRSELDAIYEKLNRLTSLCYPEFKVDDVNFESKIRSKPPLTRFRLGDLYGKKDQEVLGFIESVTYTFEDTVLWEIENGSRVPKVVDAAITYKILHDTIPNMTSKFFGKNSIIGAGGEQ